MPQAYLMAGDPLNPGRHLEMPALPREVAELAVFLRGARSLGIQVAFWRSKANLSLLDSATLALRSVLLSSACDSPDLPHSPILLEIYEELLVNLSGIVESIPFRGKVGLLRRGLIATFQQIFVLRHLCQAIVCRLRMAQHDFAAPLPAGSLLGIETKHAQREAFRFVAGDWDKQSWNVYDYL